MVKIVVLVKQTPDVEAISIDPGTGKPDLSGVDVKVSDYDKHAVEAAVQLKEAHGGEITALSLGGDKLDETIKEVLAMGCDEAVLLRDPAFEHVDTAAKARILAAAVEKVGDVDLVIAAEESADSHTAQTGPRVAEHLGWPLVSYITSLSLADGTLQVEREGDLGIEELEAPLPAVLSVGEALNEPRLPALMQILQAKNKPIHEWGPGDVGVEVPKPALNIVENTAPKVERKQEIIEADTPEDAARELAKRLVQEGLVG